jgi:hypothetical protein
MRIATLLLSSVGLLLNLTGLSFAGEPPKETAMSVVADLRDGSKLIGEVIPPDLMLDLKTEAVGVLRVPLNRVDRIEFAKEGGAATLLLQNGDRLKGEIQLRALKLHTLLGPLTVPTETVSKLQVRVRASGAGRLLGREDWQPVPFPENCDWPGDRGALSKVDEEGIHVRGRPVRSVRSYSLPLEIECEFTLLEPLRDDGGLKIMVMPPGTPEEMVSVKGIELNIGIAASAQEHTTVNVLAAQYFGSLRNARIIRARGTTELTVGKPNRLKVQIGVEDWTVSVNDVTFVLEGLRPEYGEALIQLWNWQPTSQWLVRDFAIRSATK